MRNVIVRVKFPSLGKCDNPVKPCRISDNCHHHFSRLNGDLLPLRGFNPLRRLDPFVTCREIEPGLIYATMSCHTLSFWRWSISNSSNESCARVCFSASDRRSGTQRRYRTVNPSLCVRLSQTVEGCRWVMRASCPTDAKGSSDKASKIASSNSLRIGDGLSEGWGVFSLEKFGLWR
jgi:hypothetical protein